jgi:hypothetical protein
VLATGAAIPEVEVWTTPRDRTELAQLVDERPALLFFYLFDWSGT